MQLHGRQTSDKCRSTWCIGFVQHGPCSSLCQHVSVSQLRTRAAAFELPADAAVDVGVMGTLFVHTSRSRLLRCKGQSSGVLWLKMERALRVQMTSAQCADTGIDGQNEMIKWFHWPKFSSVPLAGNVWKKNSNKGYSVLRCSQQQSLDDVAETHRLLYGYTDSHCCCWCHVLDHRYPSLIFGHYPSQSVTNKFSECVLTSSFAVPTCRVSRYSYRVQFSWIQIFPFSAGALMLQNPQRFLFSH